MQHSDLVAAAKAATLANLKASETATAKAPVLGETSPGDEAAAFAQAAQMNAGTLTLLLHNQGHDDEPATLKENLS
jgi:hypothetical protein